MGRWYGRACAGGLLLTGLLSSSAPILAAPSPLALPAGRPAFRLFTDREGLPQNSPTAIAVDQAGFVWVGTQDGAAFYDGQRWTRIDMPQRAVSNVVQALVIAPDGTLWFGTQGGGAACLQRGRWSTFRADGKGFASDIVNAIAVTEEGTLWFGTDRGLVRMRGQSFVTYDVRSSGIPHDVVWTLRPTRSPGGKGALWIGTLGGGLARFDYDEDHWETFDERSGALPHNHVTAVHEKGDVLWVGTKRGLVERVDGVFRAVEIAGLRNVSVWALAETRTRDGETAVWAGTDHELLVREHGAWRILPSSMTGLPDAAVTSIKVSPLGGGLPILWLGFATAGLARADFGAWSSYGRDNSPLPGSSVWSIAEGRSADGTPRYWFATSGGLTRLDARGWSVIKASPEGLPSNDVNAVFESPTEMTKDGGVVWAGTNHGLAQYAEGRWTRFTTANSPLRDDLVVKVLQSRHGPLPRAVWVAGNGGVARITGSSWRTYDSREGGLPHDWVTDMVEGEDASGKPILWATTMGGLARFDAAADRWRAFEPVEGGPLPRDLTTVSSVSPRDGPKELWLGTPSAGVVVLDGSGRVRRRLSATEESEPRLPSGTVYALAQDQVGRIYVSTSRGVTQLALREPAAADPNRYDARTFTEADGLPSMEGNQRASLVDSKGRVWVGTVRGVGLLEPATLGRSPVSPLVFTRVTAAGRLLFDPLHPSGVAHSFSHEDNSLSFEFALLDYQRSSEATYQTQLEGFDSAPSPWSGNPGKEYTNLPAGTYTFKAWAQDHALRAAAPITWRFQVRPAPWQTLWAYLGYLVAAVGLLYGAKRVGERELRRRAEALEEKVRERTRELGDKMSELAKTNVELGTLNRELVESNERASRIFSALAEALPGTTLEGKYTLGECIGTGGFGAVFRATQLDLQREVAVKVFRPTPGNDSADAVERFRKEAMIASRVNHPNAIAVFDSGISREGIAYIVMELLVGASLEHELAGGRRLPVWRALEITASVCRALDAAHGVGLVHRDVKPANVYLHQGPTGEVVKVLDFGIATLTGGRTVATARLTQFGTLLGTPTYMAPERIEDREYDGRSDVYSVGVLLFEMLTGASPPDWVEVCVRSLPREPPSPRDVCPDLPESVDLLVQTAMSRDAATRPTAHELRNEIERLLRELPAYGSTLPPPPLHPEDEPSDLPA